MNVYLPSIKSNNKCNNFICTVIPLCLFSVLCRERCRLKWCHSYDGKERVLGDTNVLWTAKYSVAQGHQNKKVFFIYLFFSEKAEVILRQDDVPWPQVFRENNWERVRGKESQFRNYTWRKRGAGVIVVHCCWMQDAVEINKYKNAI